MLSFLDVHSPAAVQAMRPPIKKIGPMAAPQRGGLVAPMPAFAAGGPMPDPAAPLVTSLEYVSYDDSPQVRAGAEFWTRYHAPLSWVSC